ncbi:sodium:solute symporter family transporter [Candidatus Cardinium hertigii]|uniref:HD domain-containing protein n=1 Tax=Candidatus Cardinium hertigii TaxID=247481 RepID=A0A3N2QAZ0_9BACT|nr:HD domain-containing protein [Candidatus Cardinium hertigii]ROT46974.1 HD domain-containing protein [Candidatus Cardinium hertigii]
MIQLTMPLLMMGFFLTLTLLVGLFFSRKTTTLREYAVGNKKFATATLVATVLATNFGGAILVRTIQQVHNIGLYWIILSLGVSLARWLISPLALRMAPFMHHLSMPESIGSIYGKYPRIITSLASICSYIATIAVQITVMSQTIGICINSVNPNNPKYITILATLILIVYSAFGGIRAVTFTDVLQFLTFSIIIPLLTWFMFENIHKPATEVISFLCTQDKFQFSTVFHFDTKLIGTILLILGAVAAFIEPTTMQRIYMSSGPIQAKKVLVYSGLFDLIIKCIIFLLGLFVYVAEPALLKTDIWPYIMEHISPFFTGLVSISLLAMTMSTADSCLNICAVMVSHDIVESIRGKKSNSYAYQLQLARLTTLFVGLSAMVLALFYNDLLKLMFLILDVYVPIVTASFFLAIFGFRGTGRTALIGMATGVVTILVWNKWVRSLESTMDIDGAFVAMLANGLAMLAAHYLLPQPSGTGWVEPDDELKQIRQANARKKARRKASFKALFLRDNLAKLKPTSTILIGVGIYITITTLLTLGIIGTKKYLTAWLILQIVVGSCFVGYAVFFQYIGSLKREIPSWIIGKYWLIGLIFCFPINTFWHWWYITDPLFTETLVLTHLAVALWILPLDLGLLVTIPLTVIYFICFTSGLPCWPSGNLPLYLLGERLLIFSLIIYTKLQVTAQENQNRYLRNKQKLREEQKLKNIAYNLHITSPAAHNELEEDGLILEKVVKDVTQSITFLDGNPLYKQDFQSIINKFSEWALFLKKQAKSKDHILLLPTEITLDDLINRVENALEREIQYAPRLLIEHKDHMLPVKITCDVNQIIHLLVTAVVRTIDPDHLDKPFVKIQLHTTQLKYKISDPIENEYHPLMDFSAIALVISNATVLPTEFPKIQNSYEYITDTPEDKKHTRTLTPACMDLGKKTIERIIHAHYGYLEMSTQKVMLLVLPWNVTNIREEMISKLPMESLTSEAPITEKEQGDAMMVLMHFHDYVCQISEVDPGVIAEILLLLRRCYGVKRHASGQLFYVRAVGIAQLVATWIFHSPKPIYAALLYDLIRYTRLPLSYIKSNYNIGIFCFVENVLSIDKHQELAESLFYISNRFKEAINQDHLSVLYIKLAERLYDLRHAEGYTKLEEVKYMVKETLTVDIELARNYLEPEIATALETAAQHALEICKGQI